MTWIADCGCTFLTRSMAVSHRYGDPRCAKGLRFKVQLVDPITLEQVPIGTDASLPLTEAFRLAKIAALWFGRASGGNSMMSNIDLTLPTPDDIDASRHFWNAFDHAETEISAGWIVRFCQERGRGWEPFSLADIETFYSRENRNGFRFNRLITGGWITLDNGRYHVDLDFVVRCFKASPARPAGDPR